MHASLAGALPRRARRHAGWDVVTTKTRGRKIAARAHMAVLLFVDSASPQRQTRNTEPVPPHQGDKNTVFMKRRAPCRRREAITASIVPRQCPSALPFSRLLASCEDT